MTNNRRRLRGWIAPRSGGYRPGQPDPHTPPIPKPKPKQPPVGGGGVGVSTPHRDASLELAAEIQRFRLWRSRNVAEIGEQAVALHEANATIAAAWDALANENISVAPDASLADTIRTVIGDFRIVTKLGGSLAQRATELAADNRDMKATLDEVRQRHRPVSVVYSWQTSGVTLYDRCPTCLGKAGVYECGCWADTDTEYLCATCRDDDGDPAPWPCADAVAVEASCGAAR